MEAQKAKEVGQWAGSDALQEETIMSNNRVKEQTQNSPNEERVRRAHRLWEERGCPIGSPEEDWFRAEEEIRSEQVVRDELVRARNKRVRAPNTAPGPGSAPPFSDHSGQL
jgi:hypothetical protein